MTRVGHVRQSGLVRSLVVAVLAIVVGVLTTGEAMAMPAICNYGAPTYVNDGPARLSSPGTVVAGARASPERPGATSWVSAVSVRDDGDAAKAVPETNKIFSNRVLQKMADEPGPFHNFPGPFDETIFSQGTRATVPNYFNKAKPNLSNDSIQYRLPGELTGRAGVYEISTRPSVSGRTELIMHRFFRPY